MAKLETYGKRNNLFNRFKQKFKRRNEFYVSMIEQIDLDNKDTHEEEL